MTDRRRYARTPDTLTILGLAAVAGTVQVLTGNYPGSVLALVSPATAAIWAWSLLVAATISLAGILWPDELTGWILELAGRFGVACTAAAYTWALATAADNPLRSALVLAFVTGLAASSGWRVWQLVRRLHQWWAAIQQEEAR